MTPLFAFLHHLAAFALVATLAIEFVLIREPLTLKSARQLQVTDAIFGASAGLVLVIGLLRVFYFEKGAAYYLHSAPFHAKVTLFIVVGILSIYPTVVFASWGKTLKQGVLPVVPAEKIRMLRRLIHIELAGVVLIILCAVLMAKGVGVFG
ncbi:MAG: DUF2214 family protein [Polaromonas sp.]|nr:DUF2214 family protein [Polaromonas sp.]